MSDDPRILELLEEILDSGRTPEDVCADRPGLLWKVRERLARCRSVEAQIDAIFPPSGRALPRARMPLGPPEALPAVPGYALEGVLGRGGMGVVYKARHLKLNRTVALKMLLSGAYAGRLERARFLREGEAVAALRHANVVQVYDVGEFDGRPYLTMEFVNGGSLAEKIAGVPQP